MIEAWESKLSQNLTLIMWRKKTQSKSHWKWGKKKYIYETCIKKGVSMKDNLLKKKSEPQEKKTNIFFFFF